MYGSSGLRTADLRLRRPEWPDRTSRQWHKRRTDRRRLHGTHRVDGALTASSAGLVAAMPCPRGAPTVRVGCGATTRERERCACRWAGIVASAAAGPHAGPLLVTTAERRWSLALGFCSICGTRLHSAETAVGDHGLCPVCDRTEWRNPEPAAQMLVTAGDTVLLGRQPLSSGGAGPWTLPASWIDVEETAEAAAARAAQETCRVAAKVTGIVGRPHSSSDTETVTVSFRGELRDPGILPASSAHLGWFTAERIPWAETAPAARTALRWLVDEGIENPPAHPHRADVVRGPALPADPQIRHCRHCGGLLRQVDDGGTARKRCSHCGRRRNVPAVAASFLAVRDGRVLLGRRARPSRPGFGLWAGPAGYTELGESVEDSATRELLEETSLAGDIGGLITVHTNASGVEVAYYGSATGEPRPSSELRELAWFAKSELPWGEMFDSCPVIVRQLADRGLLFD